MVTISTNSIVLVVVYLSVRNLILASYAAELPGRRCYDLADGTHHGCDSGRCCSVAYFCGSGKDYCSWGKCAFQCSPYDYQTADVHNITTSTVLVVNATRNEYYDHLDSLSSSSLSCADSLKNLSFASLHKYAWASFPAPTLLDHVKNHTSACGRCLKLTNLENGVEAMVRVVHEPTTAAAAAAEGLELGSATFHKLRNVNDLVPTQDDDDDEHHLALKYIFESCD
ncbi:Wound-induced protein WIN1 [Linum perenne]